jgi:hypothetical protein
VEVAAAVVAVTRDAVAAAGQVVARAAALGAQDDLFSVRPGLVAFGAETAQPHRARPFLRAAAVVMDVEDVDEPVPLEAGVSLDREEAAVADRADTVREVEEGPRGRASVLDKLDDAAFFSDEDAAAGQEGQRCGQIEIARDHLLAEAGGQRGLAAAVAGEPAKGILLARPAQVAVEDELAESGQYGEQDDEAEAHQDQTTPHARFLGASQHVRNPDGSGTSRP